MLTKDEAAEKIIVALDCKRDEALELAQSLAHKARWVKIGMTSYYRYGPSIVQELKQLGFKVFLDLKIYDIPFQAKGAAYSAALQGVNMLTAHCSGGSEMLKAVVQGCAEASEQISKEPTNVLGVTVLTSMDEQVLSEIGVQSTPEKQVERLINVANAAGVKGIVSSPHEAMRARDILGSNALVVTPGIRPLGSSADDQKRIATPAYALSQGASHLVIGRPITKALNPADAFTTIVEELQNNFL